MSSRKPKKVEQAPVDMLFVDSVPSVISTIGPERYNFMSYRQPFVEFIPSPVQSLIEKRSIRKAYYVQVKTITVPKHRYKHLIYIYSLVSAARNAEHILDRCTSGRASISCFLRTAGCHKQIGIVPR